MISEPDLPESLIPKCMDVLCKCATSERDLIRIIVDVVSGLREGDGDEEEVDQVSLAAWGTFPWPLGSLFICVRY